MDKYHKRLRNAKGFTKVFFGHGSGAYFVGYVACVDMWPGGVGVVGVDAQVYVAAGGGL